MSKSASPSSKRQPSKSSSQQSATPSGVSDSDTHEDETLSAHTPTSSGNKPRNGHSKEIAQSLSVYVFTDNPATLLKKQLRDSPKFSLSQRPVNTTLTHVAAGHSKLRETRIYAGAGAERRAHAVAQFISSHQLSSPNLTEFYLSGARFDAQSSLDPAAKKKIS